MTREQMIDEAVRRVADRDARGYPDGIMTRADLLGVWRRHPLVAIPDRRIAVEFRRIAARRPARVAA